MAVPKRRTSHSKQGKRRSHLALKVKQVQYCPQCQGPALGHRVCPNCGFYKGEQREKFESDKEEKK
jgi:large subunit ribosomal protein L32